MLLNKTIISMLSILFVFMVMPNSPTFAQEPNAKDCIEGTVDCPEDDDPLLDGLDDSSDEAITSESNLGLDLLRMIFALALILGLIYVSLKFINKRNKLFQKASVLENLGGISVGPNKSVQLIRIGSKVYLIGVGDNVDMLKEIEDETVIEELLNQDEGEQGLHTSSLMTLFRSREQQEDQNISNFNRSFQSELEKMKQNRNDLIKTQKKEDRHE